MLYISVSPALLVEMPPWRTIWISLEKLGIKLPYDTTVPILGIYSEKTTIQTDICTPMFTEALFTIARKWKQPRCLLTYEWIKKMWYVYTIEYYSAIRKNEFKSFIVRWMIPQPATQSEVDKKEKQNRYHTLMHIYGI